jgi:hypothetical protein
VSERSPSESAPETAATAPAAGARGVSRRARLAVTAGFLAVAFAIYAPALGGAFYSDDLTYIAFNPYVLDPRGENLRAILDPTSDLTLMVANYAPLHLLGHALEVRAFQAWVPGYHLVNVALHALASLLLAALLLEAGVAPAAALLGGAFFLVHPANVEAVAWISQLKSSLALLLLLLALRWRGRRPLAGTLAFGLALLAKALAAIALPVAAAMEWARRGEPDACRRRATYLAAWAIVLASFSLTQLPAFRHAHAGVPTVAESLDVRLWSSAAIGARYLVMAATSWGVAAFHEPAPVRSPLDPWVLGALAAVLVLGGRTLVALARRREEAAWWLWAAGSFVPVAQVFPFLWPMADRYLYFILPGLVGGALLAARDALARLPAARRSQAARAAAALGAVTCLALAVHAGQRAALWGAPSRLIVDTIVHYPNGTTAHWYRARRAAAEKDYAGAIAALREATRSPRMGIANVMEEPAFAPLHPRPEFKALMRELALRRIREVAEASRPSETTLMSLGQAHLLRGDYDAALAALAQARARGGAYQGRIAELVAEVHAARAAGTWDPPAAP